MASEIFVSAGSSCPVLGHLFFLLLLCDALRWSLCSSVRYEGIDFSFQIGVTSPVLFLPPEIFLLPPGSAVPQGHQSVFVVRFFCTRTSHGARLCFSQDLCPAPNDFFFAVLNWFPAPDQEQRPPI
jgi:hypothetical protein